MLLFSTINFKDYVVNLSFYRQKTCRPGQKRLLHWYKDTHGYLYSKVLHTGLERPKSGFPISIFIIHLLIYSPYVYWDLYPRHHVEGSRCRVVIDMHCVPSWTHSAVLEKIAETDHRISTDHCYREVRQKPKNIAAKTREWENPPNGTLYNRKQMKCS